MTDWPSEYDTTNDPAKNPGRPHWTKDQARLVGRTLANRIFSDRTIADGYLSIVKDYYTHHGGEYVTRYLGIIGTVIRDAELGFDTTGCNANDFANVHRTAWLYLANGFAYLVDKCPHVKTVGGESDWGDPPFIPGPTPHFGISRGDNDPVRSQMPPAAAADWWIRNIHNIPNDSGYFAISTADVMPAPVSR